MENIEIIFSAFRTSRIDEFLKNDLKFEPQDVLSSHFYDDLDNKDIELRNINNFKKYYSRPNTGNVFFRKLRIGQLELFDVVLIMSFDSKSGEIVINFPEDNFGDLRKEKLEQMIQFFQVIIEKFGLHEVIVGYEPAIDLNMRLLSIAKNRIRKFY